MSNEGCQINIPVLDEPTEPFNKPVIITLSHSLVSFFIKIWL